MGFPEYHTDRQALSSVKKIWLGAAFVWLAVSCFGQEADSVKSVKKGFNQVGFFGALTVNKQGEEKALPLSFFGTFKHYPIPSLGIGGGIGLMDTYWQFDHSQYFPVFGMVQGEAGEGGNKLIGFTQWGYNFSTTRNDRQNEWYEKQYDGGWMWNLGGGLKLKTKEAHILIMVAYRFFSASTTDGYYLDGRVESTTRLERSFNRIELSLGIEI